MKATKFISSLMALTLITAPTLCVSQKNTDISSSATQMSAYAATTAPSSYTVTKNNLTFYASDSTPILKNGRYSLYLRRNGNLVITTSGSSLYGIIWQSNTGILPSNSFPILAMQEDGNLVIYNRNKPIGHTGSYSSYMTKYGYKYKFELTKYGYLTVSRIYPSGFTNPLWKSTSSYRFLH